MIRTVTFSGLAVAVLLSIWQSTLSLYEFAQTQRGLLDLKHLQHNGSLYVWDLNTWDEISGGHQLGMMEIKNGILSGETSEDPYIHLNLFGRKIPTPQYTELTIRVFTQGKNQLQLFHQQSDPFSIHQSEFVELVPGWQTLEIKLDELTWQRIPYFSDEKYIEVSSWGGSDQIARFFRIDPVTNGEFKIDNVIFHPITSISDINDLVVRDFSNLPDVEQGLLNLAKEKPLVPYLFQDTRIFRTPEMSYLTQQQLLELNPLVIVSPPNKFKLDLDDIQLIAIVIKVTCLICLVGLLIIKTRLQEEYSNLVEVLIFFVSIQLIIWNDNPLFWIPLPIFLWLYRPKIKKPYTTTNRSAWPMLITTTMFVSAVVVITGDLELASSNLQSPAFFFQSLIFLLLWCSCQQLLLIFFIYPRLKSFGVTMSLIGTASFFAFVHFPNFALASATFMLGLVWMDSYRRHGNIAAIVLSQSVLAITFQYIAPASWRFSGTVGMAYLDQMNLAF